MSNFDGSSLIFDEEQVRTTKAFLPRLLRIIFYGSDITADEFANRYRQFIKITEPHKDRKEGSQKITSDRKFISNKDKLTFTLMRNVLTAMGLEIEAISFRVRDRTTGEVRTFSTDQTADELKAIRDQKNVIGVTSLL